jgi:hypothetical protein
MQRFLQAESIGYLAAGLVFLTFYMKTMIPLRIVGLCSNMAFIAYAAFDGLYPVLILHAFLLPLNALRLYQMIVLTRRVQAAATAEMQIEWFKPFSQTRNFEAGAVLFRRGDPAASMFFVLSGRYRAAEIGIQMGPGEVFGEIGLVSDKNVRTQTITCSESGQALEMTYDKIEQLFYQNPSFGFYFLRLTTTRLLENIARVHGAAIPAHEVERTAGAGVTP